MDLQNLSSNWKKLQATGTLKTKGKDNSTTQHNDKHPQAPSKQNHSLKRKRQDVTEIYRQKIQQKQVKKVRKMSTSEAQQTTSTNKSTTQPKPSKLGNNNDVPTVTTTRPVSDNDTINSGLTSSVEIGKYIALDCEMVGVGPHPHLTSSLARVSIVDYTGLQIYDSFVLPLEPVTDWRTPVSGIRPSDMTHARPFNTVQHDVASILKNRIVVGHSIRSDFEALLLDHPRRDVRDTARHAPYRRLAGGGSPKLKILAAELLGLDIQGGEHSSVEDARATMLLFRRDKDAFEREHIRKWGPVVVKKVDREGGEEADGQKKAKKKKKRKK